MEFRINITHDTVSKTSIQPNIESTIYYCPFSFYNGRGAYSHYDRQIFSTVIFLSLSMESFCLKSIDNESAANRHQVCYQSVF